MSHNPQNPTENPFKYYVPPTSRPPVVTESMRVLDECIGVMKKKSADYQNGNSPVKQAMYYPHGLQSIYDMINTKRLRVLSLMHAEMAGEKPNHESLEDSLKDMINYAAFAVAWMRGQIEGQDPKLDTFNRPRTPNTDISLEYGENKI